MVATKKLTRPILLAGSAADCPDMEYASGFRAADPAVCLLCKGGTGILVVPEMEFGRATRAAAAARWGKSVQVMTPARLGLDRLHCRRFTEWALAAVRSAKVRSISVAPRFPLAVARRLERAGVQVCVAREELFPGRAVKDVDEQRKIRECQQAAVIAMRAALAAISVTEPGRDGNLYNRGKPLTSADVRRIISRVLLDHDCVGKETIVACGRQAADPHEVGDGPLLADEPIVIDIFPQHMHHGYWGDLTRTVVKGAASPIVRKMFSAVKAAQSAALGGIRDGAKAMSVHDAAVKEFARRGFGATVKNGRTEGFIHGTGHGVGLSIHESPAIGATAGVLKGGNIVTVEPGLYYSGVGGVRIEDTVIVTRAGWQYLVPCEKKLEI